MAMNKELINYLKNYDDNTFIILLRNGIEVARMFKDKLFKVYPELWLEKNIDLTTEVSSNQKNEQTYTILINIKGELK